MKKMSELRLTRKCHDARLKVGDGDRWIRGVRGVHRRAEKWIGVMEGRRRDDRRR